MTFIRECGRVNKESYKILLIAVNNAWRHGNIGLDQLAGFLRLRGFNTDIAYFRKADDPDQIFDKIKDGYNFYGFSVTNANYGFCLRVAEKLKQYRNDAVIDFGGGMASRYYREMFGETASVDFMVIGDGEEPTEYLLNKLISGEKEQLLLSTGHSSVATRFDTEGKRPCLNTQIDFFPAFDYYLTDTAVRNSRKIHCIQTKNNVCTGNCSFCTERHGKVSYKKIESIIDQIKYVYDNFGVKKIFFTDDNIFDPNDHAGREHVKTLCTELIRMRNETGRKLAYQCYIKAISLHDDQEGHYILDLMREAGFVEVFVGIESGSDADLLLYNKFTTVEDNYTIIRLLKEHGLFPIMGFIGFNPYTTFEKMEANFRFLCDVKCTNLSNYLYSFVNINKYTAIYDMAERDGLLDRSCSGYMDVPYSYRDGSVTEIVNYIKDHIRPRLSEIQYETDWIIFNFLEHRIVYDVDDMSKELNKIKEDDFIVIKETLELLFMKHDLKAFIKVESKFWDHFLSQQKRIKAIYRKLLDKHELSLCVQLYANRLNVEKMETARCGDCAVGFYSKAVDPNGQDYRMYLDKKERIEYLSRQKSEIGFTRVIAVVLESPHIAEYKNEIISPAMGTTGYKLKKHLQDLLCKIVTDDDIYKVILMNSVQYQCSLGKDPRLYRDNMWLKLWYNERLRDNFILRLQKYKPDIVLNLCTSGDHSKETDLPPRCKTVINKKYIDHCIAPLRCSVKGKTLLKKLVTDAIIDSDIGAVIYECDHPASWRSNKAVRLSKV